MPKLPSSSTPTPASAIKPKKKPPAPPARPVGFARGSHVELGRALLQRLEVPAEGRLHRPIYDEGAIYSYDGARGVWVRVDESKAGAIVQSFDGQWSGRKALSLKNGDIVGAIACARREVLQTGFFTHAPPGLMFADTMVAVGPNGEIERKSLAADNRARFAYDFPYTDDEPTRLLETLEGVFRPDADKAQKINLVGEFVGACLLGVAPRYQRWLLFKGSGDDGKSTLIDIFRACMPPGSTCSIRPEDLEDEYNRYDLIGKLLNTVTEVKQRDVLDAETLKAIVSGDQIRGRHIREAPVDFKPCAGHLFAANGYPKFSDSSHGFWRRPIVVTFNRRFTTDPERMVGLSDVILAEERPRIVCWLLRRGAAAIARKSFLEPSSHEGAIREWRGETDAVFEFIESEMVLTNPATAVSLVNGWSKGADIYRRFGEWAGRTGHREMSSTAFGRRLTELGHLPKPDREGYVRRPMRARLPNETKKSQLGAVALTDSD